MPEWVAVLVAGAIGGFCNALLSGGWIGFYQFKDAKGRQITDPGTVGTIVVGAIAGAVFWALYDPSANFAVAAQVRPTAGSLIAGLGGAQILKGILDRFLHEATVSQTSDAMERLAASELRADKDRQP